MTRDMSEIVALLKKELPSLSDEKIAELACQQTSMPVTFLPVTVSEVLVGLRKKTMKKELTRPRIKKQANGQIRIKDTTTYRTYDTTWRRLESKYGATLVRNLTDEDVTEIALSAQTSAVEKLNAKNAKRMAKGFAAIPGAGIVGYNRALAALSVFFNYSLDKKFIEENPMTSVDYLREPESKRGRMTADEIDELLHTAISGGDDPLLDHTFLWTLLETAARVGGLLNLQLQDINMKNQTIMLYEKGGKYREQPVTLELATALMTLATSRGATTPTDSVFRYRVGSKFSGCPMTSRRVDTIWKRLRNELPWVEERRVSSHVIRHTTLTFVDRFVSPTVARRYAGHGRRDVTETYTQADGDEVAGALEVVFGRPHPLA